MTRISAACGAGVAVSLAFALAGAPGQAHAQALQVQTEPAPERQRDAAPAETALGDWSADVRRDAPVTEGPLDAGAVETIERISTYFNEIDDLQGRFIQTDPDNKRTRGRFYVQRPGRLRFDYAPPSAMRIVSDGRYLSVENHDLKTIDKYPLESTPFGLLLQEDVDLLRDAHIVSFIEHDGLAVVTLEDRSGQAAGRLMLGFETDAESELEISEWIITDPQGLNTRIQLGDLVRGRNVDRDFFATATVGIQLRE